MVPCSHRDLVLIGVREVGRRFALAETEAEHAVGALTRALDQTATGERLGDTAVARQLTEEDVVRRDTRRQSARADDRHLLRPLVDEDRTGVAVVAVADGVEQGLADDGLVEGGDALPKQSVLKVVEVVSPLKERPDGVEHG